MTEELDTYRNEVRTGLTELLQEAKLEKGDLFVVGLSTSEVQGQHIGKDSDIEIGRAIIKKTLANNL